MLDIRGGGPISPRSLADFEIDDPLAEESLDECISHAPKTQSTLSLSSV